MGLWFVFTDEKPTSRYKRNLNEWLGDYALPSANWNTSKAIFWTLVSHHRSSEHIVLTMDI